MHELGARKEDQITHTHTELNRQAQNTTPYSTIHSAFNENNILN